MTRISRPQETFSIDCVAILDERPMSIKVRVKVPGTKGNQVNEDMFFPLSQVFEIHKSEPPRIVVSAWIAKQKGFI